MMRAAWGLGAGQGASEAPVSVRILVERATPAGTQKTAARRVALKTARRLRCSSVAVRNGIAPWRREGDHPERKAVLSATRIMLFSGTAH